MMSSSSVVLLLRSDNPIGIGTCNAGNGHLIVLHGLSENVLVQRLQMNRIVEKFIMSISWKMALIKINFLVIVFYSSRLFRNSSISPGHILVDDKPLIRIGISGHKSFERGNQLRLISYKQQTTSIFRAFSYPVKAVKNDAPRKLI